MVALRSTGSVRTIRSSSWQALRGAVAVLATTALVAVPLTGAAGADDGRRGTSTQHAFLSADYDYVAQWAPCRKVGYRVNLGGVRGKLTQVKQAVQRIEGTSGLDLVYRGRSGIVPGARNARDYPADTDIVIAWALPRHTRSLPQGSSGYAGVSWRPFESRGVSYGQIIEAYVLINKRYDYADGFGSGPRRGLQGTLGQLLMHELGHAVGLAHVGAQSQVMHSTITRKRATWGSGDAAGLNRLGDRRICKALREESGTRDAAAPTASRQVPVAGHEERLRHAGSR